MEGRPIRFEIESLDIEQTSVVGLHQHRNAVAPRRLARGELHVEGIAHLDHHRQAGQKFVYRGLVDARRKDLDRQVWIEFGDPAPGDHALVEPDVEQTTGNAIQIRQFDGVEVGDPQQSTGALQRDDVGDLVPRALSDDADRLPAKLSLLDDRHLVPVTVLPNRAKRGSADDGDQRGPPRVVHPAIICRIRLGCGFEPGQLRSHRGTQIDDRDSGEFPYAGQLGRVGRDSVIEHQRSKDVGGHEISNHERRASSSCARSASISSSCAGVAAERSDRSHHTGTVVYRSSG